MKRTVLEMLKTASQEYKDNNYVSDKTDEGWESLTFSQVDAVSSNLAIGLIKEGLHPVDKVGIVSEGRSAWIVSEFAILKARAVAVPLSVKLQPEEIAFRLLHSESRFLVVSKTASKRLFPSPTVSTRRVSKSFISISPTTKPTITRSRCRSFSSTTTL